MSHCQKNPAKEDINIERKKNELNIVKSSKISEQAKKIDNQTPASKIINVVVTGNSVIYGINERDLSKNHNVEIISLLYNRNILIFVVAPKT